MKSLFIFSYVLALSTAAPPGYGSAPNANPYQINSAPALASSAFSVPAPAGVSAPASALFFAPAPAVPAAPGVAALPEKKIATIVKDERTNGDDGSYSVDVETSDGILLSESGSPGNTPEGAFIQQGSISFTHPGGEKFDLKYVANENGFQPESANLPVAPAFPHPIPQFVMEQIAFAAEEDKLAAEKAKSAPTSDLKTAGVPAPAYGPSQPVAPPAVSYGSTPPVASPAPSNWAISPNAPSAVSYGSSPPVAPPAPSNWAIPPIAPPSVSYGSSPPTAPPAPSNWAIPPIAPPAVSYGSSPPTAPPAPSNWAIPPVAPPALSTGATPPVAPAAYGFP